MNKKHILIVNEYAGTPEYGMIHRHYYLAQGFIKKGYIVTIVSASYSHLLKKYPNMENKKYKHEKIDGINYIWIKVNKYQNSFDKKRVLKWFNFTFKLLFLLKELKQKPDIVLWSSSAQFSALSSYFIARKAKAKFIIETRDIWPLTLIDIGGISPNHPFIKLMSWTEKYVLQKADIISSNLKNYSEHLKSLGINKTAHWISNGIYLEEMNKIEPLDKNIEELIPKDKFIIGYTGKLGASNAVNYLIEVANNLQEYKEIYFVIVGDGQDKEKLQAQAKNLPNVIFTGEIKKVQVQSILKLFDVCYIGWRKKFIYQYGVSPNKIFDYMYSSKPIVHSTYATNDIVQLAKCGIIAKPEDSQDITKATLKLYNMSKEDLKLMGKNGKKHVLEHFTYDKLSQKYIDIFEKNT